MKIDIKRWKLYRVVYDHYGIAAIEGSFPKERFEQLAARGYGVKWVLGSRHRRNKHLYIDIEVEGPEESLRCIMNLIEKDTGKR
ncbi:MAG: hypothetical protein ACTSPI_02355 [Candidatus Heimdallarchaeaceae archaeon]